MDSELKTLDQLEQYLDKELALIQEIYLAEKNKRKAILAMQSSRIQEISLEQEESQVRLNSALGQKDCLMTKILNQKEPNLTNLLQWIGDEHSAELSKWQDIAHKYRQESVRLQDLVSANQRLLQQTHASIERLLVEVKDSMNSEKIAGYSPVGYKKASPSTTLFVNANA